MRKDNQNSIKTLSLFSGAGGLDIGFHQAGFEIVAAVEIEAAYAETLRKNGSKDGYFEHDVQVHCEDIRSFDPSPYVGTGVELIIGGPPCQTFSAAGRRSGGVLGMDDERGQLFLAYIRILKAIEPKAFVFENVYGLPGANGGGPWQEIVSGFEEAGYTLRYEILDAADYGAPQHRERVIMVGFKSGSFKFPQPTHGPDSGTTVPFTSAEIALSNLDTDDEPAHDGPGGLYGHLLPGVPAGMNYSFYTREMGHPNPQFAWRSKFHDFLYKAAPDAPVRTIKSKPGKFTGPFHWKNRHFNALELKRLQSFPDDYIVVGSYNKVLEQIGNSVPPALARAVAVATRQQLFDDLSYGELELRQENFRSTFRQRQRERNRTFHELAQKAIAEAGPDTYSQEVFSARGEYYACFESPLDRNFSDVPFDSSPLPLQLHVSTSRHSDQLDITVRTHQAGEPKSYSGKISLEITGLRKYMDTLDRVSVDAELQSLDDLVSLWVIVEHELVKRSRFFTLIDIYGHYANRGDTVNVTTSIGGFEGHPALDAISYFSNTESCGLPLSFEVSGEAAKLRSTEDWPSTLELLRSLRWDVRSRDTHSTLARDVVLCTYPFPSISAKAHFGRGSVSSVA